MKLTVIFVIFTLIVIVEGAWWAAAVQPVMLGLGALLTTLNQDVLDLELPFINKADIKEEEKPIGEKT